MAFGLKFVYRNCLHGCLSLVTQILFHINGIDFFSNYKKKTHLQINSTWVSINKWADAFTKKQTNAQIFSSVFLFFSSKQQIGSLDEVTSYVSPLRRFKYIISIIERARAKEIMRFATYHWQVYSSCLNKAIILFIWWMKQTKRETNANGTIVLASMIWLITWKADYFRGFKSIWNFSTLKKTTMKIYYFAVQIWTHHQITIRCPNNWNLYYSMAAFVFHIHYWKSSHRTWLPNHYNYWIFNFRIKSP